VCTLSRSLLVALVAVALGCGGKGLRVGADAAGLHDGGPSDAPTSTDLGPGSADSSSEAKYAGVVLAMTTHDPASTRYVARAVFTTGRRPSIGGCPHCCCGPEDRGLPIPVKPPDAGKTTVATGATTLATLVPGPFNDGSGTYYGMSDLGWSWYPPLSDYPPVDSQPWSPGAALSVLASGGEIAPFSGVLQTGPSLTGLVPPIGPAPVVAHHLQPFEVSWTPEGNGDATVLLRVPYAGGVCFCDAPDAAGRIVVEANLLSPLSADKNGKITLTRLTISTVAASNATVDLVGAEVQAGPFAIQ
jgi:hypothetical protein